MKTIKKEKQAEIKKTNKFWLICRSLKVFVKLKSKMENIWKQSL
jgi:hypothetical protein